MSDASGTRNGSTEVASLDVYGAELRFEPAVGVLITLAGDSTWLPWDDTVKLADWLHEQVEACKKNAQR